MSSALVPLNEFCEKATWNCLLCTSHLVQMVLTSSPPGWMKRSLRWNIVVSLCNEKEEEEEAPRPLVSHILMPDMKRCRRDVSTVVTRSNRPWLTSYFISHLLLKVESCYGNAINGESYYETHSDKQNILNWKGCDHIQLMGDDNLFSWESGFFFIMCRCR